MKQDKSFLVRLPKSEFAQLTEVYERAQESWDLDVSRNLFIRACLMYGIQNFIQK